MKSSFFKLIICLLLCLLSFSKSYAQCPTVDNKFQVLCNLESLFVADLEATDNGAGVAWFDTATSTTPLDPNLSLVNGENYFADSATGDCGSRQEVILTVLGPPVGANFQGVCVENANEATIANLNVTGNDVQWYLSESGGSTLDTDTVLNDETIYYADQSNPTTNCRTSRLAVLVNVGIVPVPEGEAFQQFCATSDNIPIVSDLNATGINNWYLSESSATPLDLNTPLINGNTYFANSIDPPCESDSRLMVTVEIIIQNSAGTNGNLVICEGDTTTYDLFDSLNGSPNTNGTWSPALNSGTGVFDPTTDAITTYTYTVPSTNELCDDLSATVSIAIAAIPDAGNDGSLAICENEINTFDLFDSLNGSPDIGGTWSPELNSGTGVFDPTVDNEGIYTYNVISNNPICGSASAQINVSFAVSPDAGDNGLLQLCEDDTTAYDLFDQLDGSPDTGGTWTPALNSGTGVFDPTVDNEGTYTYTVFSTNTLCENATAIVAVSITSNPNAGSDGVLEICENDTGTFDLFASLNGSPDPNGTWSPALSSGTGVFDPTIDSEGVYTYIVISTDGICGRESAQVTVSFTLSPNAGNDGALELCENDTTLYDLFDSLNGAPDNGGIWSPTLNSGTGIFDPAIDSEGIYTYTVSSSNPLCENATAIVVVTSISTPNAGSNGSLEICESDTNAFNLFDSLNGSPDPGGTWSPSLNSGTDVFDPTNDNEGVYTYTVQSTNPICGSSSAQVSVSFALQPNAGTNGTLEICDNDSTNYDLFNSLNGSPDTGGVWSPTLNSGTSVFDPTTDNEGIYTYTVSSTNDSCEEATATVTITITPSPDAGTNGTIEICNNDTNPFDLFDSLNGNPDTGGIWTPTLTSGTGVFDPNSDTEGVYTYTVESMNCEQIDTAEVLIITLEEPNLEGLSLAIPDTCKGTDLVLTISNAFELVDGDYSVTFEFSGANTVNQNIILSILNGAGNLTLSSELFTNSGAHQLTITNISSTPGNCNGDVSNIPVIDFIILDSLDPILIEDGNSFCASESPTIESLTNNIVNSDGYTVNWYNTPEDGVVYDSNTLLNDGVTYYASMISTDGCESSIRLAVTASITNCTEGLIIPDGFSPNNDGINDTFNIKNIDVLYPNFKITVYNRYGNKLYEGDINSPQWNGTSSSGRSFGNSQLPVGVYIFIIDFNDGIRKELQGRVYLNR